MDDGVCRRLADDLGATVAAVDYRAGTISAACLRRGSVSERWTSFTMRPWPMPDDCVPPECPVRARSTERSGRQRHTAPSACRCACRPRCRWRCPRQTPASKADLARATASSTAAAPQSVNSPICSSVAGLMIEINSPVPGRWRVRRGLSADSSGIHCGELDVQVSKSTQQKRRLILVLALLDRTMVDSLMVMSRMRSRSR